MDYAGEAKWRMDLIRNISDLQVFYLTRELSPVVDALGAATPEQAGLAVASLNRASFALRKDLHGTLEDAGDQLAKAWEGDAFTEFQTFLNNAIDAYVNQIDVLEAMSAIFDAQQRVIALAQQDMVTILDQTWKALYATIFDGGSLVADLVLGVARAVVSIATAGADTAMAAVGAAFSGAMGVASTLVGAGPGGSSREEVIDSALAANIS